MTLFHITRNDGAWSYVLADTLDDALLTLGWDKEQIKVESEILTRGHVIQKEYPPTQGRPWRVSPLAIS